MTSSKSSLCVVRTARAPELRALRIGFGWMALAALSLSAPPLHAQDGEGDAAAPAPAPAPQPSGPPDPFAPPGQQQTNPAAWEDVNSYLRPSERPSVDGSSPGFDMDTRQSGGTVILGGNQGNAGVYSSSVTLGDDLGSIRSTKQRAVPEFHMVKKGDTLWAISSEYYQSPWEWPRLWSMNPQVENPHWIYPGDQLRTGSPVAGATRGDDNSAGRGGFVGRSRTVPPGTIFLRDVGYIGDPERDVWGELVGSREDVMMLGKGNVVYLQMNEGVELRLGQRLSIFDEVRSPKKVAGSRKPPGELVKVYGTVRIDTWDRDTRVARGMLIESVDVIERGAKVGPVGRRFDVVPPKKAEENLEAAVLTGIYPHIFYGGNQIVFIDKGSEDGLVPGNRLRAVRHGDVWRRNLKTASTHTRLRVPLDSSEDAPAEVTPLHGDDDEFPDEVIAEVMVLRTEEYSSTCLVTESARELVPGDKLVAVAGY